MGLETGSLFAGSDQEAMFLITSTLVIVQPFKSYVALTLAMHL
jgi:hypothetical protein